MLKITTGVLTGVLLAGATSVGAANIDDLTAKLNLTSSQVETLESVHELKGSEDFDRETIKEMIEDAGIDTEALHEAKHELRDERRAELEAIFESGDYDAFVALSADRENAPEITESQFEVMVQAHELREAGDREGAREVLEEVGIDRPERPGKRGHRGPIEA